MRIRNLLTGLGLISWLLLSPSVMASVYPENFHQVSPELYRSAQPSSRQMAALQRRGIHTVLNLRQIVSDKPEARNTSLILYQVGMNPAVIRRDELVNALRILHYSLKPVLIHCWHGSDRTGLVVALYELVFHHVSRQEALAGLRSPDYGYHESWYPGIAHYIETVDIDALRKEVLASPEEPRRRSVR